jgi:hypothetical protein
MHTLREANACACYLAKIGVCNLEAYSLIAVPPNGMNLLLQTDASVEPCFLDNFFVIFFFPFPFPFLATKKIYKNISYAPKSEVVFLFVFFFYSSFCLIVSS